MKHKSAKILLVSGLIFGSVLIYGFVKSDERDFAIIKSLDIFYSLFRELNLFYVDETNPQELIETGIESMLESLDPYTVFIPEADLDEFNFMTTGNYGGIGSLIRAGGEGYTLIADPYEGSPAARAGLRGGDLIISIDGSSTKGKSLDEVSEKLKGEPGSPVKLEIKKPGKDKYENIKLIRETIHINNVSYFGKLNDETGYIRLSNFTLGAGDETREAFETLKSQGITKVILDLRGNPGGLLMEAVKVCNIFMDPGQLIVSTKGKVKQWDQDYYTTSPSEDTEIPVVVLVNRGSASAAEIVAGAIQDLDRGLVVGERTFGKGLVQATRKLKYNTQLKVTTAKYYIPSGRCIQALDYSHRNEDGSVGHVPDSLVTEFRTKGGRLVYDGGGIVPDVRDTIGYLSEIATNLYARNYLFDYITHFMETNPEIPAEGYKLTDADYGEFGVWLRQRKFSYTNRTEVALKDLVEKAKSEQYYDLVAQELNLLENKLKPDVERDLKFYEAEIRELIHEELMGRYYFQSGRIRASLPGDTQVTRALSLISDEAAYNSILAGKR